MAVYLEAKYVYYLKMPAVGAGKQVWGKLQKEFLKLRTKAGNSSVVD